MKCSMTYHAQVERANRLMGILSYVELGEIIAKVDDPKYPGTQLCLTNTGIVIVRTKDNNKVVTAYLCTVAKCLKIVSLAYGKKVERIPSKMFDIIKYNEKHYKFLYEI